MDRIILTAVLVAGYFALVVAANVETPVEAVVSTAAAPASADGAERWYSAVSVATDGARTADAAERAVTSAFDRLPKPDAPR
jgi:hypothetical protein